LLQLKPANKLYYGSTHFAFYNRFLKMFFITSLLQVVAIFSDTFYLQVSSEFTAGRKTSVTFPRLKIWKRSMVGTCTATLPVFSLVTLELLLITWAM